MRSDADFPLPESVGLEALYEVAQWLALDRASAAGPPEPAADANVRPPQPGVEECGAAAPAAARVQTARRYLRARRKRESMFPQGLFADPAWDILLDLFVADADGARISVSSACVGAGVPQTTALRWLATLEEMSLIERREDAQDGRRCYVQITPDAKERVSQWLAFAFPMAGEGLPQTFSCTFHGPPPPDAC